MIIQRFHLPVLGHASHVVACPTTREAIVVDARLDIEAYLDWAAANDLRIVAAVDTHAHADYVSGITRLIATGDVQAWGTAEGGVRLGYDHQPLRHGDTIAVGAVTLRALHLPGHTPEHLGFLASGPDEAAVLLSGGSLLCGDIGRPDVAAWGEQGVRDALAVGLRALRDHVLTLPADTRVLPTHVAGTLCAGGLSGELETTIAGELAGNPWLRELPAMDVIDAEHLPSCTDAELAVLPPKPTFWSDNRVRNLAGWTPGDVPPSLAELTPESVLERRAQGAVLLDGRPCEAVTQAHVPGSIAVGCDSAFGLSFAGQLAGDGEHDVVLVATDEEAALALAWNLRRIGVDAPLAMLAGGIAAWQAAGQPTDTVPTAPLDELGDRTIVDVRMPSEWATGTMPGAVRLNGLLLPEQAGELPDGPLAVVCEGGTRSLATTSWLRANGRIDVVDVPEGMAAWNARQYETA
jgi:hydroxyacylglutathione hydrolase